MYLRLAAGLAAAMSVFSQPSDLEHGRAVYRSNCAFCHGQTGLGGRGPNLVSGERRSDADLKKIIRDGVPGSTMPAFGDFSDAELERLIVFVRHLSAGAPPETISGDSDRGRTVYQRTGCPACHQVGGAGSTYGPDLSRIGAARSVAYLRESIVDPSADIPAEYESVEVVARDGRRTTGVRVNEDTFSIQLRLQNEQFRSFYKDEASRVIHSKVSLMPAYKSLAARDLDDLIAFLKTLRGGPAEGRTRAAEGVH